MVILRSRYEEPVIPSRSLPAFVLEGARRIDDSPAVVDGATGVRYTPAGLREAAVSTAGRLLDAGVTPGAAVGLSATNQAAWVAAFYGILFAGAAVVPLNPGYTVRELENLLGLAGASAVVADAASRSVVRAAADPLRIGAFDLEQVTAPGETFPDGSLPAIAPGSVAVIAFSSGTTGVQKAVELTHRNLVATLVQHEAVYHLSRADTVVAALPLFHIYGMSIILSYALRHSATIVTLPRFDLGRYLQVIEEHRVTWLHIVPPIARALLSDEAAGADFSSVRHVVSGAAPLDAGLADRLASRIGCRVGQGYGMTEASPGVTWVPDDGTVDCPPGSVGVLVAGTEGRLIDPATGADTVGPGELWVRGPQVMRGYRNDEFATASTIVDGEWLRTGDIVRIDEHGVCWVVDRLKEMIKYKGYQVAPAEVEAVLMEHPAVLDVGVAGVPDAAAGELPVAWVSTRSEVSAEELIAWVAARVAPYKRIRAVHFVESIPRSAAGKILRRQLRAFGD